MTTEEYRGSAFIAGLGATLEEWRPGYMRFALRVDEAHSNPRGFLHGGVLPALMDEALGGAIASARGMDEFWAAPHSTIDLHVSFLASARLGDQIVVEARTLKVARAVGFAEAEARRSADGALIAKGNGTVAIQRRPA